MIQERARGPIRERTAPSPQHLHRTIARIAASLRDVEEGYRWAYNVAYGSGGGATEVRTSLADSDPTGRQGLVALGLSAKCREIGDALAAMETISAKLARDMRGRPETVERPDHYGDKLLREGEFDRLREAKLRREGRGEGWGRG